MAEKKETKKHHLCEPLFERCFLRREPAVYKIINPLGEVYIGGTKNVFKRYGQYSGDSFKGQPKLLKSFDIHVKCNHIFEVIEYCTEEDLHSRERYWSLHFDVISKGLNLEVTGDNNHRMIVSDDVRQRIGLGHKGKPMHPNTREALILSVKGKKQTADHLEKRKMFGVKNPMYGKTGYWKWKKIPEHVRQALLNVNRSLEHNGRAKKVINIKTGEIFPCAKAVLPEGMKYSTFKSQLQGRNPNNTDFRYL